MTKRAFEFYKNNSSAWYLDLPEWNGDPEDLQMVEGADEWLDLLSAHTAKVTVTMSDENFEGAASLKLLRLREKNLGGGGIYDLEIYHDKKVALKLWLCGVTEFVFGRIPQRIYFKV
jgi:hypothetical protein